MARACGCRPVHPQRGAEWPWDAWDDMSDEVQEAATAIGFDEECWPPSARRPTAGAPRRATGSVPHAAR